MPGPAKTLVNDIKRTVNDTTKVVKDLYNVAKDTSNFKRMPPIQPPKPNGPRRYLKSQTLKSQVMKEVKKDVKKDLRGMRRGRRLRNRSKPNVGASKVGQSICVPKTEFITDIQGSSAYTQYSFPIGCNSPATFPWLSGIAQHFETYHFKRLKFYFQPLASNITSSGSLGECAMVINYDPSDPVFTSINQICTYYNFKSFNPTKKRDEVYKMNNKMIPIPVKFVQHDPNASALNDFGVLYFATSGTQTGVIGKLFVEYEVCLYIPRPPVQNEIQIYSHVAAAATSVTNFVPMSRQSWDTAADPTVIVNSNSGPGWTHIIPDYNSSGYPMIAFDVPGYYLVQMSVTDDGSGTWNLGSNHSASTSNTTILPPTVVGDVTSPNSPTIVGAQSGGGYTFYNVVVDAISNFRSASTAYFPNTSIYWTSSSAWQFGFSSASTVLPSTTVYVTKLNNISGSTVNSEAPTLSKMITLKRELEQLIGRTTGVSEKRKSKFDDSHSSSAPPNTPIKGSDVTSEVVKEIVTKRPDIVKPLITLKDSKLEVEECSDDDFNTDEEVNECCCWKITCNVCKDYIDNCKCNLLTCPACVRRNGSKLMLKLHSKIVE